MDRQTKFVIVVGPRTGSTYLVDYLDAVSATRCCSELFRNDRIDFRHHQPRDPRLNDIAFRDAEPAAFVDLAAAEAGDCQRFGFKLIGTQIPKLGHDVVRQVFAGRDWKKIYLWRDDLFEQSVSYALAAQHFGDAVWGRTPDQQRITIPPKQLLEYLHIVQTTYFIIEVALGNAHGDDVFALNYDDLGRASVMGDLLRFLGLPPADVDRAIAGAGQSGLDFKPGPGLAERIENHAEIRRFFLNSRYRRLIERVA